MFKDIKQHFYGILLGIFSFFVLGQISSGPIAINTMFKTIVFIAVWFLTAIWIELVIHLLLLLLNKIKDLLNKKRG